MTMAWEMSEPTPAAADSAARRENLNPRRRNAPQWRFFIASRPSFYDGRAGQASAWPGSFVSGFSPLHVRHPLCETRGWRFHIAKEPNQMNHLTVRLSPAAQAANFDRDVKQKIAEAFAILALARHPSTNIPVFAVAVDAIEQAVVALTFVYRDESGDGETALLCGLLQRAKALVCVARDAGNTEFEAWAIPVVIDLARSYLSDIAEMFGEGGE